MPINARPILTHLMYISKRVFSCYRTDRPQPVCLIRVLPRRRKTSIPKHTNLLPSMDLQLLSGALLSLSNRLRDLLHRLWVRPNGTDP